MAGTCLLEYAEWNTSVKPYDIRLRLQATDSQTIGLNRAALNSAGHVIMNE